MINIFKLVNLNFINIMYVSRVLKIL